AVSALYEIFEWLLTIVVAPGYAESYNVQQGDAWDAQKDMALALLGSALAWPLFCGSSQSEELTANHDPVPEATGR
ncbi:MAG: DUF2238 domain-containing protein, partial [Acidobacteriota bacterium]